MTFLREPPADPASARRALYDGEVLHLGPTPASLDATTEALALLREELGLDDVRAAHALLDGDDVFRRFGRVRKRLYLEHRFHQAIARVVAAAGFDPAEIAVDPLRLRIVVHKGDEDPRAAPVYYAHRDTWYAHPQALITWWIPLFDLPEEETFVFYPDCFRRPVPNDSETFDYEAWVRDGWGLKIGWQDREAGRTVRYPGVTGDIEPGPAQGFACRAGDNLLFSGSQFHRTRVHAAGRTRYSLDFRMVHLGDHAAGLGAPNVDNRSRGSCLGDYVRLS
jgi:ectoine hydroxylase-related dioxygenase (phytanoyl-CoA dioxygenase family)